MAKQIISIDFSDVKGGFEPVDEGRYACVIENVELDKGKEPPHNPYFKFTLKITDGEFEGRKLWTNMVLTENSLWVLKASLEALGYEFEDGEEIDFEIDGDTNVVMEPEMIGHPCCVDVYNTVYRQKTQNNVDVLLPISDYAAGPAIKKSGTSLKLNKKKAPTKKKPAPKKVVEEPVEEEVVEEVEEVEADEEEEIAPVVKGKKTPAKKKPSIKLK